MCKKLSQQGFSLVELMIALVIGLLVTLGAFQLFLAGKKSFDHELALAERQSSLRFLVDTISYDIRSASYTEFVDGAGTILSTNEQLVLSFDKDNSICSSDVEYKVKYFASDGSIKMNQACGATAFPDDGIAEPIVLGVGSIRFFYLPSSLGIRVEVEMVDDRNRLPPETFSFQVANRSSVGKALELWGE
ncbi:prepilin-type N-terminal cleavage/methylation domain-containing protein [Halomonas fontilapidosi]|uniref:Prepilin-type N-terminal cleavage/methylation domain-containing protein n=1 Tax=Halomonas fontilapidosi TaxID=616675 RepID=A0A7W5H0M9_9GAMM|nr:prepilin-type N-terminal cleavage/methylation domain-containing protein [Halomonas fontilapidosi]MBB3185466.1 prepilin-type N-terminal cleavage/methylation domain-containing protein [Halomonas fontilapidosi]